MCGIIATVPGVRQWLPFASLLAISVAVSTAGGVAQQPPGPSTSPTFTQDVAPIVFEHCVECHRPSGSGPFSLLTYDDVHARAPQIVAATRTGAMPPWKPAAGSGEFVGERRLSSAQIAVLERWVSTGAREGDPRRLPPAPQWPSGWSLGEPDLILGTEPYVLRADGDDMYRNFVIPIPIGMTRYIKAWQFIPDNGSAHHGAIHHATMQFDSTDRSKQLDAQDPAPGYEGVIPHSVQGPNGYFLDWGPGHSPYVAPDGMAWPLQPRTHLVMMLHLKPSGKRESIHARLGLYFSDRPPTRTPTLVRLTRQHLDIAAGERDYRTGDSFTLPVDVDVFTIQPHAHYLAREVLSTALLPDGTSRRLISIPDWDFNWQGIYRYRRPVFLPAGTRITMSYRYDNSDRNRFNPNTPPRRVTYGQRTSDEMCELWFQVVPRSPRERPALEQAVREKITGEEIIGHEKMLEQDPNNPSLHDDVALLYAQVGDARRTVSHFASSLALKPGVAAAHYNLGAALLLADRRGEARDQLKEAIRIDSEYALAMAQLSWILVTSRDERLRDPVEGLRLAHRAGELTQPQTAWTLDVLAAALAAAGEFDRAIATAEKALGLSANDQQRSAAIRQRLDTYRKNQLFRE